jgi:hypothetical protein
MKGMKNYRLWLGYGKIEFADLTSRSSEPRSFSKPLPRVLFNDDLHLQLQLSIIAIVSIRTAAASVNNVSNVFSEHVLEDSSSYKQQCSFPVIQSFRISLIIIQHCRVHCITR